PGAGPTSDGPIQALGGLSAAAFQCGMMSRREHVPVARFRKQMEPESQVNRLAANDTASNDMERLRSPGYERLPQAFCPAAGSGCACRRGMTFLSIGFRITAVCVWQIRTIVGSCHTCIQERFA